MLFSMWTLLAISMGLLHVVDDFNARPELLSIRIGVALMSLAPLMVASVMAARNELLIRVQYLAGHDVLTGVLNRGAFTEQANVQFAKGQKSGESVALLMLDLDHFKSINDSRGHDVGDRVLAHFAALASSSLRETDCFGRIGGEEFAVLLAPCSRAEAMAIAERIRARCEVTPVLAGSELPVVATVSIGVAFARQAPAALAPLLSLADVALYDAKHAGRNRAVVADLPEPLTAGADIY